MLSFGVIGSINTLTTEPSSTTDDPPYWQIILREFVFKTISAPPTHNDILYKKILEAPFYGGPFPEPTNDENALISRGDVYHTSDGRWILCQEGCVNCHSCTIEKNPTVKWSLKRVKRITSQGSPKWDLQLTVVPQVDENFHNIRKSQYNGNQIINSGQPTAVLQSSPSTTRAFAVDKPVDQNLWSQYATERDNWVNEEARGKSFGAESSYLKGHEYQEVRPVLRKRSRRRGRQGGVKRYRSKVRSTRRSGPLTYYYPQQESISVTNSRSQRIRDDSIPRLIMGIDQHGEKHLVHVVPIESLDSETISYDNDPTSYQGPYQSINSGRLRRTIRQGRDITSYQKLIERVFDSLGTHRNFIEKFLFSEKLEPEISDVAYPYFGRSNDDERFDKSNYEDYRSSQNNQYPDFGYQVDDQQDEAFIRHPEMRRKVNNPGGEYQVQNTMIEYEPYEISAEGQQPQQQQQDESSLPPADVERRRRNSFSKLMDLTAGHQSSSRNYTQLKTESEDNYSNETLMLTDSRFNTNQTDIMQ